MELSAAGLALIKRSEGFRSKVYLDVAGIATIGYGHRLLHPKSFPDGIDEATADQILACDVDDAEGAVDRLVKVALTQGQYDALVDFVFNLGEGALEGSTLLDLLNAGLYSEAAEQFLRWDHARVKGVETVIAGLEARRLAEFNLWNGGEAHAGN